MTRLRSFSALSAAVALILASGTPSFSQQLRIVHCLHGCPTGGNPDNILVVREIYALSADPTTKFADWVAYRVTKETIGTSQDLNRTWRPDPLLTDDETLEPNDYSGASNALDIDRGHQAPLASFAGTVFWRTTNYLSNITPQKSDLNQGPWVALESAIRDAAYDLGEVYVVTGPLYGTEATSDEEMTLPNADETHDVPSAYWKIVATDSGRMASFLFDQETPRAADYCDLTFSRSIAELENVTGLDFFPEQTTALAANDLRSNLGC